MADTINCHSWVRIRSFARVAVTFLFSLGTPSQAQPSAEAPPQSVRLENLTADEVLAIAGRLVEAGRIDDAQALLELLEADGAGGTERDFLDGMLAMARKDYARAEAMFRRILQVDPSLVRVRLELARTLFLAEKDEQADYQFRLAIAEHPPEAVVNNIARFREAIRARRAWRFNVNFGIVPDSNINSATGKETVDLYGLPFKLDDSAQARSGTGVFGGGDASLRLFRESAMPLYLAAYGRWLDYPGKDYDDIYAGGEAGPEFQLSGGRLRLTGTAFQRWYGSEALVTGLGGKGSFEKVIGGKTSLNASLALRHDDYARRSDLDAWNVDTILSANRALSPSTVGFAYAAARRSIAHEPGYSNWNARIGGGVLKEIVWGLRPQIGFEVGRQVNDKPLGAFGTIRRDWSLQANASIYKRDWSLAGFAPSIKLAYSRNFSTIALYDQERLKAEFGFTKAF